MRSRTTVASSRGLVAVLLLAGCASSPAARPTIAPPVATPPAASPLPAGVSSRALRAGIVSVRVTGQEWNWRAPWEKLPPWNRTVTGLVVPGQRILAASTAFGNHLLVEVQKLGSDERSLARVELVDQEGPLALIAVDDPAFWTDLEPLPLAGRAPAEGAVSIHRWQRSGLLDSYPGTVRQMRAGRHGLSQTTLLTLDVATGAEGLGESEVVIGEGKVAGLLTGRAGDTFAALASPVLARFLEDARSGDWRGFARAGVSWQDLTNPALREALGLRPGETGIRLLRVAANGSLGGVVRPGDVLLEVDGVRIDNNGRYEHPVYGRMLFAQLFTDGHRPGDRLKAAVLRDGQRLSLEFVLRRMLPQEERVPPYQFGSGPAYVIAGGLVFQELSRPYLGGEGARRAPPRLLVALDREGQDFDPDRPRIVLLSSVLPDAANLGYQNLRDLIVERVNGQSIGSLDQLRRALGEPRGPYHVVELLPGQAARRLVIGVDEARAAAARIASAYGIAAMDSADAARPAAP